MVMLWLHLDTACSGWRVCLGKTERHWTLSFTGTSRTKCSTWSWLVPPITSQKKEETQSAWSGLATYDQRIESEHKFQFMVKYQNALLIVWFYATLVCQSRFQIYGKPSSTKKSLTVKRKEKRKPNYCLHVLSLEILWWNFHHPH